jgi:hypothetical protein
MNDRATYVRTETVPLGRLQPFPGNAKIGNVSKILESLRRNGQYRSLIVREHDGTLTVLAGNHTLQALAAHGPGPCDHRPSPYGVEHPCAVCQNEPWKPAARVEVVTCDDDTATRVNLADNATSDAGSYDELALASLIEGLGGELGGTGYTDADLATLVTALDVAIEDEPDDPYDDEPDEQPPATPPVSPAPAAPAAGPDIAAADHGPHLPAPAETPPPVGTDTPPPAPAGPGGLIPQFSHERVPMVLHYPQADRDEAARLVAACRETFTADDTGLIVLRALRTLVAVLDSRHNPDGAITVAALTRAAGADL